MKKSGCLVFSIIIMMALSACSTPQKGNMTLVVSSYKQSEGAVHQPAYQDEAMKMQIRLEKVATLIADCLLTLDYMAEERSVDSNRKSFSTFFNYLASELYKYRDRGLDESVKSIYDFAKEKALAPRTIRVILEHGIIENYFKKYTGKIKCTQCYDYQEFLGHISFWYYLLAHDFFNDAVYKKNKICGQSIVDLRGKFTRKIYREFMSKFDYIRDADTLQNYQDKHNIFRVLDRGKNAGAHIINSDEKKIVIQPFVKNSVDMVYEIERIERDDFDISTEGLEFHFKWK